VTRRCCPVITCFSDPESKNFNNLIVISFGLARELQFCTAARRQTDLCRMARRHPFACAAAFLPAMRPKTAPDMRPVPLA
jgi:hypothetical protein